MLAFPLPPPMKTMIMNAWHQLQRSTKLTIDSGAYEYLAIFFNNDRVDSVSQWMEIETATEGDHNNTPKTKQKKLCHF
jgi:hypothetical protein